MNKKSTRALASATVLSLVLTTAVTTSNVKAAPGKVTRLGGETRYATAANVARNNWKDGAKNVILVSGNGYPDALSASLLSKELNAPILLTEGNTLSKETKKVLAKLKPTNVYVLGGTGAISQNVRDEVNKSYTIAKEFKGDSRFDTNKQIADFLAERNSNYAKEVFVVNGNEGLADALSVAPVSAAEGKILLIVGKNPNTAEQAEAFVKAHKSKVTVIGTENMVSKAVAEKLSATRIDGGKDRFETNLKILKSFSDSLKGNSLYIANGSNASYVDSLIASTLAGKAGAPMVLVDGDKSENTKKALDYIKPDAKTNLNVVGGEGVVSNEIEDKINKSVDKEVDMTEVEAYEKAPIKNMEQVKAAKKLGEVAKKEVAKLTADEYKDVKAALEKRIEAVDAKVAAAEKELNRVEVESAKAINETAVQVEGLAKDVKEADLKDKKITLKAGDKELTATYVATSLTEDGKANFVLEEGKKLEDAATYKVSSDWAKFATDTFMAKGLKASYVKTVTVSTKAIPAMNYVAKNEAEKVEESGITKVYFTAKNQYGEEIALTEENVKKLDLKAKLNGVPMLANEISKNNAKDGYMEIKKSLAEGNKIDLTLTNKVGEKTIEVGKDSYTVIKAEKAVPTTVSDMKATYVKAANKHEKNAEAKEVLPGDEIKLTATVKDQFNNHMDEDLRWVVEEGKDLIDISKIENDKDGNDKVEILDSKDFDFKVIKAGKFKVSAYNANGKKATYEVIIGAKELKGLNLEDEKPATNYNKDEIVVGKVTPNDGANLTADMIKFDVKATKTTVDVTPADVKVTAKVRGGKEENKNDIVISAKTTKAGTYTITPYVGESLKKATAKGSSFDVTTTIDQTVASIDDIKFDVKGLKTGKAIKKDITFKNKHGEVVVLDADKLEEVVVTPEGNVIATITKETTDSKTVKNVLTLSEAKKGNCQVTIQANKVFKSYTLNFENPTFTRVDAGKDITGVVAGDKEEKAKYQQVKFLDQDGKGMDVKKSGLKVFVTKPDGQQLGKENLGKLITLCKTHVDKDGKVTFEDATLDTDNVGAYKVNPKSDIEKGVYTVKITNTDGKISDTFTVTVGSVRVAKTVEITPASTNVALNGKTSVKIVPKDQYGEFINVGKDKVVVDAGKNFEASDVTELKDEKDATKVVGYEVTLTGKTKGTNDVVVNVNGKEKDKKTPVLATNKVSMGVDSVANLVNSVSIDKEGLKDLYLTETKDAPVNLKSIAKDSKGSVIPIEGNDLNWSVVSVKNSKGEEVANKVDKTDNKIVTVDNKGEVTIAQSQKGKAVIKVQTANMKEATIELNFDNAKATAKKGTTTVVNSAIDAESKKVLPLDANKDKEGIQVALDGDAKDGEEKGVIKVNLDAKDQYGNEIKDINNGIVAKADDTSVVRVAPVDNGVITLTANGVGTSNVYVQYNGDTIKLEVSVNDKAVKEAEAAKKVEAQAKLDEAAETAVKDLEGAKLTTADEITAAKALVQPAKDAVAKATKANRAGLNKRITDEETKINNAEKKISDDAQQAKLDEAAETAVKALEGANLTTADEITAAKALVQPAKGAVAKATEANRADLNTRIADTEKKVALAKIEEYAVDTESTEALVPTVEDYKAVGITVVTEENLTKVNTAIKGKTADDVKTTEKIQGIVTEAIK